MQHAKRLLGTDRTVADIASTLGFSSCSNFCIAFRRELGITPGQFRQVLCDWKRPVNQENTLFSAVQADGQLSASRYSAQRRRQR
jgi:AraC-like DNA-binding protein